MLARPLAAAAGLVLLVVGLAHPPTARAEETILFYQRLSQTSTLRPAARGGNLVTDTTRSEILVALGDHRMVVYEPEDVWLYDFAHRRVRRVSRREGTYSDWSLHAFVAFKEMELEDRLALRRRVRAARPGFEPSVLELESLFSIPARSTRPGRLESLADSSTADRVRVWINGHIAVEGFPSDTAFAPGRAAMFNRFLAYQAHLHPIARRALVRSGKVPRQFVYRFRDFNEETVVKLRLMRISSAPEDNDPLAASTRVDVDDPKFGELNRRLADCRRCAEIGDWTIASRRFEAAAIDSGRYLDAALARIERVLGACERDSSWSAEIEARVHGDTAIAACRAGLAWHDSAGAAAALVGLERVNGAGLTKGYMIDYLRGRARIATGNLPLGAYMMLGGLGGNPCMAGGWLDLGRDYLHAFQPVLGWICLEAAEQATIGTACEPRLAERPARERELEKRYPDLFE